MTVVVSRKYAFKFLLEKFNGMLLSRRADVWLSVTVIAMQYNEKIVMGKSDRLLHCVYEIKP